jgi:hypothetical protein
VKRAPRVTEVEIRIKIKIRSGSLQLRLGAVAKRCGFGGWPLAEPMRRRWAAENANFRGPRPVPSLMERVDEVPQEVNGRSRAESRRTRRMQEPRQGRKILMIEISKIMINHVLRGKDYD